MATNTKTEGYCLSRCPPDQFLTTQTEETIPREKLKMLLYECIQERDTYIQETYSDENKPRQVKDGDFKMVVRYFSDLTMKNTQSNV
jgi:hypothetical protein